MALTLEDEFGLMDQAWAAVAEAEEAEVAAILFIDGDGDLALVTFQEEPNDAHRSAMMAACAQTLTILGEQNVKPPWIAYAGVAFVGVKKITDINLEAVQRGDMQQAYLDGDPDVSEQLCIIKISEAGTWMQRFRLPLHEPDGKPWGPNGVAGGALGPILHGLWAASQFVGEAWHQDEFGPQAAD